MGLGLALEMFLFSLFVSISLSFSQSVLAVSLCAFRWVFSIVQLAWPQAAPGSRQITFDFRKWAYQKNSQGKILID